MTRKAPTLLDRYFLGDSLGAFLGRALAGSGVVHAAGLLVGFLVGIQLARGLGVESYGQYGIAMAVIAMAGIPGEFGLPRLVTREVAAAAARSDLPWLFGVLRWANRTAVLLSLTAAAAIALIAPLLIESAGVASAIAWGAAFVPLVALTKVRGAALQGLHFVVLGQVPFNLLRPLFLSLLLFPLFKLVPQAQAAEAMILNVVAAALALIAAEVWLHRRLPQSRLTELAEAGRGWLASAFPMALTDGILVLQGQLFILMLGVLAAADQVGLFRVAVATATMVAVPVTLVGGVIAPVITRLHAEADLRRLQLLCTRSAQMMAAGILVLALPIFLAGPDLISLLFGAEYRGAFPPLAILCIGQIANAAFGPNAGLLVMSGHERRVTRATAISLVIGTVAVLALVPVFGLNGAALSSSLALLVWNLIAWSEARRLLGIDTSLIGGTFQGGGR